MYLFLGDRRCIRPSSDCYTVQTKHIEYLIIDYLIRIVIIFGENRNTAVIEMLQYRYITTSTSALSIVTLTNIFHSFIVGRENEFGNFCCDNEEHLVCISFFRKIPTAG